LTANTNGFLSCVCEGIRVGIDNLALDLVGPASVVSQAASNGTNISLGHAKSLAVIERLNSSEEIEVPLDQIGELDQQLASVFWCLLSPRSLECLAGRSYGNIDILLVASWTEQITSSVEGLMVSKVLPSTPLTHSLLMNNPVG